MLGLLLVFPLLLDAQTMGINPGQQIIVDQVSQQITAVEWLAPLAPVALSPFFGIALLSGMACFGPAWLQENALLSDASPLSSPIVFWVFVGLTILTSLPRMSKVSKPVAQVADFVETYSAIIILIAMKLMTSLSGDPAPQTALLVQAGFLSLSYDVLIAIAMAVNIVVINSVKFFFELLVWITPVPALDACFEIANKALCAALMAIYAVSPMAALLLNILLFLICLSVFGWVRRRETFYRHVLMDYVLGWFNPARGNSPPQRLVVYPAYDTGPIKRRSRCHLMRGDTGLQLVHNRWWRGPDSVPLQGQPYLDRDWWTNSLVWSDGVQLTFTRRYDSCLDQLAEQFGATIHEAASRVSDPKYAKQLEFN